MDAATILQSARTAPGRSQEWLAAAVGTQQPSVARLETGRSDATVGRLNRLLDPLGSQVSALPTKLPTIASWAASFADWIDEGDLEAVRNGLLRASDDIRSLDGATAVSLCVLPPGHTGSSGVDAALASLVEYTLVRSDLPVPKWAVHAPPADEPFFVVANRALRAIVIEETPSLFARRNVWVPRDYWESV
jgi:transcriptional regulator with XRE-family HTH domain